MISLITGITGQDGSYLAEYLLQFGHEVIGLSRRTSTDNTCRLTNVLNNKNFTLIEGDITDYLSVSKIIDKYQPDHIYNLAAQSHVGTSFEQPAYTWSVNAIGPMNILESVRRLSPDSRVYQASTSEMFGDNFNENNYQDETTPFNPNSPYGIAKLAAHEMVRMYRTAYNIFAVSGILFNHESPRRGENFVTRKITKYISGIVNSPRHPTDAKKLYLGNLDASRDWSHVLDMVHGMFLMLDQDEPHDYVLCSGETHTIREFLDIAFSYVNLNWNDFVEIDPKFFRPCEVEYLCGSYKKARNELGWSPKINFENLVHEMVDSDKDLND